MPFFNSERNQVQDPLHSEGAKPNANGYACSLPSLADAVSSTPLTDPVKWVASMAITGLITRLKPWRQTPSAMKPYLNRSFESVTMFVRVPGLHCFSM